MLPSEAILTRGSPPLLGVKRRGSRLIADAPQQLICLLNPPLWML